MLSIKDRLHILKSIYDLYEDQIKAFSLFCRKGCAVCCTANVTVTTLEGLVILKYWQTKGHTTPLEKLTLAAQGPRFQPKLTLNHLARLCAQGQDLPEEGADPNVGPCPLLENNACSIYEARPFGCRAMVSREDCAKFGAADMPDEVLTANNLILQYIEAVDMPGVSGNLVDLLMMIADETNQAAYAQGEQLEGNSNLIPNQSIPVLMIPPEHRQTVQPLLQAIQKLLQR